MRCSTSEEYELVKSKIEWARFRGSVVFKYLDLLRRGRRGFRDGIKGQAGISLKSWVTNTRKKRNMELFEMK